MKILKWVSRGLLICLIIIGVLLVISMNVPDGWKLTPEVFLILAASVLSLSFTYAKGWRTEFAALTSEQKVYVNLIVVVLIAIVMFAGTCTKFLPIPGVVCSQLGLKTLLVYVFLAVGGNQLTYVASPQPADVIAVKIARVNDPVS